MSLRRRFLLREGVAKGGNAFDPLAFDPIIYIDSRLGYTALADSADVPTLKDQSGNALDLPKGGAVAPATIQKTTNLSPTGAPVLRFKLDAGACLTDLGIYSLTWAASGNPSFLVPPARQPNGYSYYWWVRGRRVNMCGGGGGSNGAGGGSTNRPRIRFFYLASGAIQITVTNGGLLAWSCPLLSETSGVGAGVHTIALLVPGTATSIVANCLTDRVQRSLIAGQDTPLTEWNEALATEYQIGNAPTTTPAITGAEGLESDLGCHLFYAQQHSVSFAMGVMAWMQSVWGRPL